MATVNKDFKIKSGLIVEGTTGTINGYDILTESQASIDFIVDVIGGETLVTSVESTQLQVVDGELSVKDNVFDASGAAAAAETAANSYTDGEITTALTTAQGYATTAQTNAEDYADGLASNYDPAGSAATAQQNAEDYADQAETDAVYTANSYTDTRETAITTAYQTYADQAESDANSYTDTAITNLNLGSTYDAYGAAAQALTDANSYTDQEISALVDSAPAMLDTLGELATALQENPDIISDLQDIAAGKQDAVTAGNGLVFDGATLHVDPATSGGVYIDVEGKLAADGYYVTFNAAEQTLTNKTINGTDNDITIVAADVSDFNSAAITATGMSYDAYGSAATAKSEAIFDAGTYTDGAISTEVTNRNTAITDAINALDTDDIEEGTDNKYFTDTRAKVAIADLLTNSTQNNIEITGTYMGLTITAENGVADSTTDDLVEGEENLYFNDERAIDAVSGADIYPNTVILNNVSKQVATQITAETAGIQIGNYFSKSEYRSAEFLVKVAYGTHTELSKVLLTLDTSDNIAITEYGIVGTNGSASSISADVVGDSVRLLVTTTNNNSTVTVMGTLLI